jgi:hypothetical protein
MDSTETESRIDSLQGVPRHPKALSIVHRLQQRQREFIFLLSSPAIIHVELPSLQGHHESDPQYTISSPVQLCSQSEAFKNHALTSVGLYYSSVSSKVSIGYMSQK